MSTMLLRGCASAAVVMVASGALAAPPSFQGLGALPDTRHSIAAGVSADGRTVVGFAYRDGRREAFRWTRQGGMQGLGFLDGGEPFSDAYGVSGDGSVIVGTARGPDGIEGFRWTAQDGFTRLGDLAGGAFLSNAFDICDDGDCIVGNSRCSCGQQAVLWDHRGGPFGLGDLPGGQNIMWSTAWGISGDGRVIVGVGESDRGSEGFVRQSDGTMRALGDLAGGEFASVAYAASGDGSVVTGWGSCDCGTQAFIWRSRDPEILIPMGFIATGGTRVSKGYAIAADGSMFVGTSTGHDREMHAFVWDWDNWMRPLKDVLAQAGVSTDGWQLREATDVSADGRIIVGWGINPQGDTEAFVASLGTPCRADLTEDNVVDGGDFLAFLGAFFAGDELADFTGDGSIDGGDFLGFLGAFFEGC